MRVGIIGAGATGLTAAYELAKRGHDVVVYERASFLGGQASTFDVGGAPLERGYHHLFTGDTDILDLIDEIGLGDRMRWYGSKVGTLYDGKIYNFVTPIDLLKFKPLSLFNRFRLGISTLLLRRMKDWRHLEDIPAADWLRQHAGEQAYDVFWGPMLRGKFGEEFYGEIGMPWIWGKINTRFASRGKSMSREMLGYPIGSFGEVFDVLGERVRERGGEVHLNAEVSAIGTKSDGVTGLQVDFLERGESTFVPFDAVISTTQCHIFARLLPDLPSDYMAKLKNTNYLSALLLILVLDRPLSHIYWLNVADRSVPFVGVIEQSNMVEPEHYGGRHIV
ncbi:MAG: FAD-dependent oxidoreductase, partial [Chloroflexota bacterium]|nr:FAD-dependent oxidoreductase [Chloroflexota bacterium]